MIMMLVSDQEIPPNDIEAPAMMGTLGGLEKLGSYSKIKAIKASVGGFWGGYTVVDIDFVQLEVTGCHGGNGHLTKTYTKQITAAAAETLLEALKELDLLSWKYRYVEPEVCDGTQWQIQIHLAGKTLKKTGDNKFPDEWEAFCRLITGISGRRFK